MNRNKKPPPPPRGGKGTAPPRQLGLLMDLSPEGMMASDGEDDHELEAELLAIVGDQPGAKRKPNGKTPLPMEAIERMAAFCMKDLDEEDGEDEDDLEDDDELLAELNEVLEEEEDEEKETKDMPVPVVSKVSDAPADSSRTESILEERLAMYKAAIATAKQAGESSKVRRYERGLKTLENLLTSARKGKTIDEDEIPPPVATGKTAPSQQASSPERSSTLEPSTPDRSITLSNHFTPETTSASPQQTPPKSPPASDQTTKLPPPVLPKPKISPPSSVPLSPPEKPQEKPASLAPSPSAPQSSNTQDILQARQRAYKLAALRAKQEGNIEMATKYYRIAKTFDPMLASVGKGETVNLNSLPPPPEQLTKEMLSPSVQQPPISTTTPLAQAVTPPASGASSPGDVPPPPRDMMEALQQRMERYKTAAAQAKSKGDDRKARMHERIVKQYQDAIRAHKAGKPVEFAELPVPPGFPPIQGTESSHADQSFAGILETAMKLANEEDEDAEEAKKPDLSPASSKPGNSHQPGPRVAAPPAPKSTRMSNSASKVTARAQQQLTFLETRKKQLMQAALRAKQQNDIEGAKMFLRQAKGLDPMIEASQNGLPVDITKVPQAPVNKEDFTLGQRRGAIISPETAAQYAELVKLMRQQHEMCMNFSKQFTHLGNITETAKFEKMAEDCKKNMEILKQAHTKGFPLPKYHYEQRTFSVVKIFPELNSNDMILYIVKGINLPAPPGMSPSDLDAFVRFDFPYPNVEEAQKDKTNVIKNTNAPEFQEKFKLFINRGHRGLKRAIQTKGIKFEVVHKGGLFKTDRVVGTAQLKLEALETSCEVREILELLDGRRPTGGKLEVIVRLREPLTSQQLETTTEKWLVIDPLTMPPVALPKAKAPQPPGKDVSSSKTVCTLHSFNVLAFDKERLEKKIMVYKQAGQRPPGDLIEHHQNVIQMIQRQKSQLQQGGPAVMKEYLTQLERYQQWYTEAAKRLGSEGKREAAKDALYKRNLVECELQKFHK
nr:coiled-coil and C2 domain-containing protein 1A isoform X1 [Anolis sagrei ordinatus]